MRPTAKEMFRKGEGLELMIIMIKEKKFARRRALKVLDYGLNSDVTNCERFVEILGLKTLFSAFMKRSKKVIEEKEDEEHAVGCIAHLLKALTGENLKRVLHKFVEDDHAKVVLSPTPPQCSMRFVVLHPSITQWWEGGPLSGTFDVDPHPPSSHTQPCLEGVLSLVS